MIIDSETDQNKLRLAKNIVFLTGQADDIVIGNSDNFRFLHIENGKAFLSLVDKLRKGKFDSINNRIFRLLHQHNILINKNTELQKVPASSNICCGKMDENTLILPLSREKVDRIIYEKSLDYILEIIEPNGMLSIKFYGSDPVLAWDRIEGFCELIAKRRPSSRSEMQLKYHFNSKLEKLPQKTLEWIQDKKVSFSVFLPLTNGFKDLEEPHNQEVIQNLKKLIGKNIPITIVTPAVQSNINDLIRIANYYSNLSSNIGCEFPAIHDPSHQWEYGDTKTLPIPEDYSKALIDIYKAGYIKKDLFAPVNHLHSRITNGGYSRNCSCDYQTVTIVDSEGNLYPCLAALQQDKMVIGNVKGRPEQGYDRAQKELTSIQNIAGKKCDGCVWKGLCGSYCLFMSYGENRVYDKNIIDSYICKPRLKLIKEIIWDIVDEIRYGFTKTDVLSNGKKFKALLVMLQGDASSPCYEFTNKDSNRRVFDRLSVNTLKDLLLWAGNEDNPSPPQIFFIAGNKEPLAASIATILEDMGDHFITPLLSLKKQRVLKIPFSVNQTVVAKSLKSLLASKDNIQNRPIILHIEHDEIPDLAGKLLSIQNLIRRITLRIKNPHNLQKDDLLKYKKQLDILADMSLMRKASSIENRFDISNLDILDSKKTATTPCPAGSNYIVVGADKKLYSCMAFYRDGKGNSFGTIDDVFSNMVECLDKKICGICNSSTCFGCTYLEQTSDKHKETICKIYEIEKKCKEQLLERIARSGYLFDCLGSLKTRQSALKSKMTNYNEIKAKSQIHDIEFEEFTEALTDIELAARYVIDQSLNGKQISTRWTQLPEIPHNSLRNVFRERVREILTRLEAL
jgi:radical SAM protein with 4Fe4S-binding SPASM domain